MPAKLTQEQVVARFRKVHGDRYEYSQVKYTLSSSRVTIICPIHGPFDQIADQHARGAGCRACANAQAEDKTIDMVGRTFGMLTVLRRVRTESRNQWLCRCECGNETAVSSGSLNAGTAKSCGCSRGVFVGDANRRHGQTGANRTRTYTTWMAMTKRCRDENGESYHRYGGNGISVCEEWLDFEKFYADMGDRPAGTTIDRIDGNLGYFKENCRWATAREQANNRISNRKIIAFGETHNISVWARRYGLFISVISSRIARGWSTEDAVSLPPGAKR